MPKETAVKYFVENVGLVEVLRSPVSGEVAFIRSKEGSVGLEDDSCSCRVRIKKLADFRDERWTFKCDPHISFAVERDSIGMWHNVHRM